MEWSVPPVAPRKNQYSKFEAARAELKARPGEWGVLARERKNPIGPGTKTCWQGFEMRHVRDPETHLYTIYCRYVGDAVRTELDAEVEMVAMALHRDAHPGAEIAHCRCREAARIAVETIVPRVEQRTKDSGWVPFGTHAIFSPVPPLVFSEDDDMDGLPRWERIDIEKLDAYLEPVKVPPDQDEVVEVVGEVPPRELKAAFTLSFTHDQLLALNEAAERQNESSISAYLKHLALRSVEED